MEKIKFFNFQNGKIIIQVFHDTIETPQWSCGGCKQKFKCIFFRGKLTLNKNKKVKTSYCHCYLNPWWFYCTCNNEPSVSHILCKIDAYDHNIHFKHQYIVPKKISKRLLLSNVFD